MRLSLLSPIRSGLRAWIAGTVCAAWASSPWTAGALAALPEPFSTRRTRKRANLVSMWTAPSHRQTGVGRLLVDQVVEWVGGRNVSTLLLMVTSNNGGAIRFYEKLGFVRTGRTEPYPNDPGRDGIRDVTANPVTQIACRRVRR